MTTDLAAAIRSREYPYALADALDRLSDNGHFVQRVLTADAPRGGWVQALARAVLGGKGEA